MTTVGYGDKTPRSVAGRLFSVLWILAGIIVFNILAGELTSVIIQAKTPGKVSMANKRVGTLNRNFDNSLVLRNGGILLATQETANLTDEKRFFDLVRALKLGSIDGFLIDTYTYRMFKDRLQHYTRGENTSVDYFLHETMLTDVSSSGNDLSYGVLIKFKSRFDYFQPMFESNRLAIASDTHRNMENSPESDLNHGSSLIPSETNFWFIFIPIGCISCFGFMFEILRKKSQQIVPNGDSQP